MVKKQIFFLKRPLEPTRVAKLLNKVFCLQTPCSSYPCKNGGKCVPNYIDDHYHCDCTAGFSGDLCQTGEFHRPRKPRWWSFSNAREKLKLSDNYSKQLVATLYQQVNYVNFFDSPFQNQKNSPTLNWTRFSCSITNETYAHPPRALKNKRKRYNLDIYIIECYAQECHVYWFFIIFFLCAFFDILHVDMTDTC